MDNQNLIIFKFETFYKIFKELEQNTTFKSFEVSDYKMLQEKKKILKDYIIITKKEIKDNPRQVILDQLPIKFFNFIEKLNIEFLKLHYNEKSEFKVGKYKINLNSRELIGEDKVLKLTEKEIKIITYLSKLNKPVSINELQSEVWDYNSKLETHTVETHVYRLREKISKNFNNKNFIESKKSGYKINLD